MGVGPMTSSLPKRCATAALRGHDGLACLSLSRLSQALRNVALNDPIQMVGGTGFEPVKAFAGRFTVCSLWPLGHPPTLNNNRNLPNICALKDTPQRHRKLTNR